MTKQLQIFLLISALAGCFPAKHLFENPLKFDFNWVHPSTIYAVLILIFNVLSSLDYFIVGLPTYVNDTFGLHLANKICGYVDGINYLTSAIFARIFAIINCAKTIELIKIIQNVKNVLKVLSSSGQTSQRHEFRKASSQLILGKLNLNQVSFNSRRVYFILWVTILFHFINHTTRITAVVANHRSSDFKLTWLPLPKEFEWVSLVLWWLNHWVATVAYSFSVPIIIILGVELISLYHQFISILLNSLLGHSNILDNHENRNDFIIAFKALMDGFAIFSDIGGTYALINVVCSTVAQGQSIYQLVGSNSSDILTISMTVVRFFWFYNQASLGELIKFYIKQGREDIRNGLALGQKLQTNESVRELAEWVGGWKWKFTACNIFKVDRNLILRVFETVMTYVIFLFQLKLSDQ